MLDNSALIAEFAPEKEDGDTFIYTEMLDRGKRKGNNGQRLVKTFYHRSRAEFWEQWPTIKQMCDLAKVRACTRLSPRSFKKVGKEFTRLVVETALTENWAGMKSLYNRALGIVTPNEKYWLWDVDVINDDSDHLFASLDHLHTHDGKSVLIESINSKKGVHYITRPFDIRQLELVDPGDGRVMEHVQLHKDNPTNLYIPDGAD